MSQFRIAAASFLVLALSTAVAGAPNADAKKLRKSKPAKPASNVRTYTPEEAKRAVALLDDAYNLILHETHDTYPTKPGLPVAASLVRELQEKMTAKGWPSSRFLAVNAILMNPNHQPKDDWERQAVAEMKSGKPVVEHEKPGEYRATTMVALRGGCTSCHWSQNSLAARAAISWKVPTVATGAAPRN